MHHTPRILNRMIVVAGIIALILATASFARAHDVDNICSKHENDPRLSEHVALGYVGGQIVAGQEHCRWLATWMYDVEVYGKFKEQWHHRRNLVALLIKLGEVRGRVNAYEAILRRPYSYQDGLDDGRFELTTDGPFQQQIDYWHIIPATPVMDAIMQYVDGQINREWLLIIMDAHIDAAKTHTYLATILLYAPALERDYALYVETLRRVRF